MSISIAQEHVGPFCQSCGMPLLTPSDFGTGDAGVRINDYCVFCFRDGRFTEPGLSKKMMIDRCVEILVRRKVMTEPEARALVSHTVPALKRWKRHGNHDWTAAHDTTRATEAGSRG